MAHCCCCHRPSVTYLLARAFVRFAVFLLVVGVLFYAALFYVAREVTVAIVSAVRARRHRPAAAA